MDTDCGRTGYTDVVRDIDAYAKWASLAIRANSKFSLAGCSSMVLLLRCQRQRRAVLDYYRNISAYAYAKAPSRVTPETFNPGNLGRPQLFAWCDLMVQFENGITKYRGDATVKTFPTRNVPQSNDCV